MKPILYTSSYATRHDTGVGHPETAARITALEDLFQTLPYKDWPQKIASAADLDTILLAHDEGYVFDLQYKTPDQGLFYYDSDTILSPHSYDAALHGAGAACDAVDDIMTQNTSRAFCAIRPPGHHAEPNTALGFCLFNNVFIAARYAQEKHGVKKIAIVDFDVHHGNGTDTMTRRYNATHPDRPILYISTHGYPLFPMTGDPADNTDLVLNFRLPDDCGSAEFRDLYEKQVFPALNAYKPDLLLLSAGFDAHKDDALAQAALEVEDYSWLTRHLCDIAAQHSQNRVISILEGGYDIPALTECVVAHLEELSK